MEVFLRFGRYHTILNKKYHHNNKHQLIPNQINVPKYQFLYMKRLIFKCLRSLHGVPISFIIIIITMFATPDCSTHKWCVIFHYCKSQFIKMSLIDNSNHRNDFECLNLNSLLTNWKNRDNNESKTNKATGIPVATGKFEIYSDYLL